MAPEISSILNRKPISRELGVAIHRSRNRLAVSHARAIEDINHVLVLGKE